ncbi:MAG: DUF2017 domain-containing protein [Propionibacteriales bacterium]|nr:DUF2017 domain-containing protein [Propionibacteriales bacterium]
MSGFTRHRKSGMSLATFSAFEADLLRSLAGQLIELLRSESATVAEPYDGGQDPLEELFNFDGPTVAPEDPVLLRLFPTAYTTDDEAAAEFRRYTENDLRSKKAAGAACIIDSLEEAGLPPQPEDGLYIDVELDAATALTWMRSFTDMRLAIATRLGIEDGDEERWYGLADDDPESQVHDIYEWIGFLQETLVRSAG